jgi:hypothetical protein
VADSTNRHPRNFPEYHLRTKKNFSLTLVPLAFSTQI